MFERDTRVQIVIIKNNRYILLKHWYKPENRTFWGLPGGGKESGETDEEAAIREAYEETGLRVSLLSYKLETKPTIKKNLYKRIVTFIGTPVDDSEAKLGFEPEAEEIEDYQYELIDIKWQDLYDNDIDDYTMESIKPVREYLRINDSRKEIEGGKI